MSKIVHIYLCDRAMICKDSPGCSNEGGPCYCTTDKSHARLQKNGKPIIIDFRCDDIEEKNQKMADNVNHPAHYTDGKYETIEFIERHGLSFHEGNAVKYISRAGKKDPDKMIEDLEKALWYIKRASNAEDYCPEAITAHDYILDKKLSPALASTLALIEASEYEKAEDMLKAEVERLKKQEIDCNTCNIPCCECTYITKEA